MTERLAGIGARVDGIRQLGAVINAMRGIAAARAQQARGQLAAVDSYAATIAQAISRTIALLPAARRSAQRRTARSALVLFCAEQGFAGAFSERVLDAVADDLGHAEIFLIGTRGAALAAERGVKIVWHGAMPSHSLGIPKLADQISEALYRRFATGEVDVLDAVFSQWRPGQGLHIQRRRLFPLDLDSFAHTTERLTPLLNLTAETLLLELTADYVHAQLCNAALHAFAGENEARMEAMASAHRQVERELTALQGTQRVVRQQEITEEIIELAAGEAASRSTWRKADQDGTPHR